MHIIICGWSMFATFIVVLPLLFLSIHSHLCLRWRILVLTSAGCSSHPASSTRLSPLFILSPSSSSSLSSVITIYRQSSPVIIMHHHLSSVINFQQHAGVQKPCFSLGNPYMLPSRMGGGDLMRCNHEADMIDPLIY